ncbi:MAG: methyltransferase domain-containing protein, partial [Methanotrichaceae archaeon]
HKSDPNRIGITEKVDFALAFYMVHEAPNAETLLKEIASIVKPKGKLLIVEPKFHVSASAFKRTIEAAQIAGFKPIREPNIFFSRSMLFQLAEVRA